MNLSLIAAICAQPTPDKSKLPHWLRGRHGGGGKSEIRATLIKKAKRRAKNGKRRSVEKTLRYLETMGTENRI